MSKKLTFIILGLTYLGGKAIKSLDETARELAKKKMEENADISEENDFDTDTDISLESEKFTVIHQCTHCGAKISADCENGSVECEYCNTSYRVKNGYVISDETVMKYTTQKQKQSSTVSNRGKTVQGNEPGGILGYFERKHIREMEEREAERKRQEERQRQLELERQQSLEEMKKAGDAFISIIIQLFTFIFCFPMLIKEKLQKDGKMDEETINKTMTVVWIVYAVFLIIIIFNIL